MTPGVLRLGNWLRQRPGSWSRQRCRSKSVVDEAFNSGFQTRDGYGYACVSQSNSRGRVGSDSGVKYGSYYDSRSSRFGYDPEVGVRGRW